MNLNAFCLKSNYRNIGRVAAMLFPLAAVGSPRANADTLASNLSSPSGGADTVSGANWLAVAFGTDAASYTLDSITLLLANTTPGTATLDLYNDGGLQPGSLVSTLASSASYSSSLTNTTFTASSLTTLDANSTYWAVLHANSGAFDWSFANDNNGTGVGFQTLTATSGDSGATWFPFTLFPYQLQVLATPTASAVPEPGSLALLATGGLTGVGLLLRRRQTHLHRAE